jgi:glutaconate CoA-transferase subunit B
MACFGREYIMMPRHEKRNFVENVDYVSGVGYPGGRKGRKKLGLDYGGPKYIYTPKCIFGFDDDGSIFLKSVHKGVSLDEVAENTGFAIPNINDEIPVTPEPTDKELRILREEIDPKGIFFY